jgi:hypothetical protein
MGRVLDPPNLSSSPVPLVIGQFLEMIDADSGIVGSTTGSNYYVREEGRDGGKESCFFCDRAPTQTPPSLSPPL